MKALDPEIENAVRCAYDVIHEPFNELLFQDEVVKEVAKRLRAAKKATRRGGSRSSTPDE